MTNSIKRKLHSNRGASMMLALALMLFCVMVSSVIITAAASGTSRSADRKKQQQEYLAVSSAANLVAKELQRVGEFSGERTVAKYRCSNYEEGSVDIGGQLHHGWSIPEADWSMGGLNPTIVDAKHENLTTVASMNSNLQGAFKDVMYKAAEAIYSGNKTYSNKFTIKPESTEERLPAVECYLVMDDTYNVSVEISTAGGNYVITVLMTRVIDPNSTIVKKSEDVTCSHLVYYRNQDYDHEEYIDGVINGYELEGEIVSTIDRITWGKPQIIKGGISE